MVAIQTQPKTAENISGKNTLLRAAKVVISVGKTALRNLFTLQSERLPADETIELRIERYLSAPMNEDGSHPDPMAPEYRLFD